MLRIVADKIEEIPEGLRDSAKQVEGQGFVVQTLKEGWGIEDIGGLKRTVSELRNENKTLAKTVAVFDGIAPESVSEAREALEQLKAGKLRGSKEIDDYKASVERKMAEEQAKLGAKLAKRTEELRSRMLRGELAPVIAQMGGAEATDAILTLAQQYVRIEEADDGALKTSIVDRDGKPRVTKKGGSADPMGYDELIAEMREASSTRGLFKTQATGGSGGSSQTGGAGRAADPGQQLSARELFERANART